MAIKLVKKNSGYIQKFSLPKLKRSIEAALKHCGEQIDLGERLAHEAFEYLEGQGKEIVDADAIRQVVIHVIRQDGLARAAASYELTSLHLPSIKIHEVVKRDGKKQTFHPHKLFKSLVKAFRSSGAHGGQIAEELTKEAITRLERDYSGKALPVTVIKKTIAQLLAQKGFKKVERSYLLHKYL